MNRNVLLPVQFFLLTFLRLVVIILGLHLGQQLKLFNGAVQKKKTPVHTRSKLPQSHASALHTHTHTQRLLPRWRRVFELAPPSRSRRDCEAVASAAAQTSGKRSCTARVSFCFVGFFFFQPATYSAPCVQSDSQPPGLQGWNDAV